MIEYLSFDVFNEGTHLKEIIFIAHRLTGKKVKLLEADAIYATNVNRKFASKNRLSLSNVLKIGRRMAMKLKVAA
ncbi:hypothetical protein AsAng_0014080 [Aureispira anguillae]|uniref:Uncharacterized protein n=1 Tax=Aureispira anguillae TaxID=2864201 RepID=A0A915YCT2_9BACT|nr:hypothetical protein AsAng_0014080 [Aureispira anguillae]